MDSDLIVVIVVATALGVRLHERLPRHGERRRHLDLDARDAAARRGRLCAAILNFVGAFISLEVAATVAKDIVERRPRSRSLIVFAGLVGAIAWNLITWYFGLPSSSSHALIGGDGGRGARGRAAPSAVDSATGSSAR